MRRPSQLFERVDSFFRPDETAVPAHAFHQTRRKGSAGIIPLDLRERPNLDLGPGVQEDIISEIGKCLCGREGAGIPISYDDCDIHVAIRTKVSPRPTAEQVDRGQPCTKPLAKGVCKTANRFVNRSLTWRGKQIDMMGFAAHVTANEALGWKTAPGIKETRSAYR